MSAAASPPPRKTLAEESPSFEDVDLQRLRQLRAHLKALAATPGWQYLKQVLTSQCQQRLHALASEQPYSTRDMVEHALLRGEAAALDQLAAYPEFLEAAMQVHLEAHGIFDEDEEQLKEPELNA